MRISSVVFSGTTKPGIRPRVLAMAVTTRPVMISSGSKGGPSPSCTISGMLSSSAKSSAGINSSQSISGSSACAKGKNTMSSNPKGEVKQRRTRLTLCNLLTMYSFNPAKLRIERSYHTPARTNHHDQNDNHHDHSRL